MASLSDRLTLAHQQYHDRALVAAQQTCQQLLEQAPDHPEALALMGCIWHGLGHPDRAEACWRQTIALKSDYAEAHNNLGAVLQGRGDLDGAIAHYQQAITHHPTYAEAYCNLGNALQMREQVEAAITHYQRAIQLKPDYAEAHSNLGTAYQRQKQFDAAIAHYQQALALRSDYPETHYNWGRLLEEQEDYTGAESHYRQAIALKPNYAAAHNQLGYRLQQRHAYAEAEYHYRQAIALGFESIDTHHCLAVMLHNQGQYEAAIAQYDATIARKPDHGHARLNRAIAYLILGDFSTGWREYEWRWQVPEFRGFIFSAHPRWEGEDLNGQTILLHSEQGLGDTLQFVRYATLVAQRGGTVLVSCPDPLRRLFTTVPGVSQVVERFVPNHLFQTYAALMSLPYLLGTTVDTIPATVPYLRASTPPPLTLTAPPHCRLKVGLVWSGNPANGQNFRRSCPLAALAPLWQLTDVAFYSLQKELPPADQAAIAALPIQDLGPYLGDFADTAALIEQLDLVISVDTAVAHLAGAMAKPVWLLLADVADWRWLLDREDSPWYPTMRIFRQARSGDWDDVLARVVAVLSDWSRGKAPGFEQHKGTEAQRHKELPVIAVGDGSELAQQGMAALREERWADAIAVYQQVLPHHPKPAVIHFHLGYARQRLGQVALAESHYQAALTHQPDYPEALSNLGYILMQRSQWEDAIAHYRRAIALAPDFEEAHYNLAIALLTQGNFAEGWAEHEWRWQIRKGWVTCPHPRWDGSDLNGQTILLHSEQGLGDAIQFVRYVALVVAKGGRVLLQCRSPLVRLFAAIPGVDQVFEQQIPNHLFQVHAPLMSLPYILGTRLETIPATVPYLQATTPPPCHLPKTSHLKIGLVWSGNQNHPENGRRTCPLAALQPLFQLPNLRFYSLQKEVTEADRALLSTLPIQDLSPYLGDLADTAALIDQLDWVISVDTSVAHLAGAMAKPVWLLLADVADWRWLLDREDSPWYPTMRIFRQPRAGNWDDVIARVVVALTQEPLLWGRHPACPGTTGTTELVTAETAIPQAAELIQNSKFKIQNSEALAQQGMAALRSGQWESAIAYYQQALPDYPQPAEIHFHLGYAYHRWGDENRAMEQYQRALSLRPDYPEALCNLGNIMQARQQWETAIAYYHRALAIVPDYADVHNNLGTALFNQDQLAAAIAHYQQALKVKPDHLDAHYNLGNAYVKQRDFTAAIAEYQQVLAQNPNHIEATHNLASCLFKQGDIATAIGYFQQVIALDPNHVDAHFNLSVAWLIQGDFLRGFVEYEWRWQTQHFAKTPPTQPQWDGSDLAGRRILLHPEQGYGDLIQFIRYAPLVAARGGRVIVCCPENLQRLFATVPGIECLLHMAVSQQDFEICAPLLSLPRLLGTTLETIPATVPYLQVPSDAKIQLTASVGKRLKVGLVWAGSPDHPNDAQRSCGLEVLRPLLALSDIAFYSLQVGSPALALAALPEAEQAQIADLSPQLTDFGETAAAIAQLDLVITVDTSVAHLAGALAKPTWVLLSYIPDWRWLLDREDSPWYPTLRLFRQPQPGNWEPVITQVLVALQACLETKLDNSRKGFAATIAKKPAKKQMTSEKRSHAKTATRTTAQIGTQATAKKSAEKSAKKLAQRSRSRSVSPGKSCSVSPGKSRRISSSQSDTQSDASQPQNPIAPNTEINAEKTFAQPPQGGIASDITCVTAEQRQTLEQLLHQGTQALEQQDWSTAIAAYQQAIALNPNLPRTLGNLGVALHKVGDLNAAITYYQAALRQKPDFPEAHHNLGKALQEKGDLEAASNHYRQAIALDPTYPEPYYGLASILAKEDTWDKLFTPQDQFDAIKSCYEQLLQVCPQEAAAYNNLGSAYFRRGRIAEAVTYFEQAIAHDPHLSPAHRNLGLALLTQGDLVRGFVEYRWRWQVGEKGLPDFKQPQWDGSDLTGKTILLYPEQGHGDIVQFVRYASLVAQRGGRVIVSCYTALERLIATVDGVDQVVTHHEVAFDTFFPLMDLPIIFQTDLTTVPAQVPYVKAPEIPPLVLQFPAHIRLKVGIVWAGNPKNPTDQKRSCPLRAFLPLLELENIAFYSLQVGGPATQLADLPAGVVVPDLSPHLKDFADTAAVIEQLDLVITVDTAVAHVAGALGKPTWILLSALPDWRWLLDREDSPWYPTVRLFRQTRLGDWAEVMTRVVAALVERRDRCQPHESMQGIISYYQEVLRQKPDLPEVHYNLGKVLQDAGELESARHHYQQAIALNPAYAKPYYSLASILALDETWEKPFTDQDQFDALKTCYEQLLQVCPQEAAAYNNLGLAYFQRGKIAEAAAYFEQAIAHNPNLAIAHKNLGFALLTQGDLVRGFAEYRWRWQVNDKDLSDFKQPQWDGSNLTGKTIFLYPEQGYGDVVQFVRYVPLVTQRGGRVIIGCYAGLERLIATVDGVDQVVTHYDVAFDTFFPLMDLPIIFQTDLTTVPAQVPYLKAPAIPPLILQVPDHILLKVGIVWAGSPKNSNNQKRSCPLLAFLPLLELENIAFYSLQVGESVTQLANLPDGIILLDLNPHLKDFADTAAVIEQLDLVITVDTAVAHVAGALGKPTWILLSALPDWRWLLDRDDSPWYPTVRLFRQTRLGDWAEVMTRVVDALTELRDTCTQPHPFKQAATVIAALTKQGNTYLENKQWDAAIACFRNVIALQPNLPTAHYTLGWLYKQQLNLEQAEQHLRRAIAIAPDFAEAHFTLGTTLLLRGDWLAGWEEYEWRFKTALFQKLSTSFLNVDKTCLTDRQKIAGKRILICKEQGFGDQIQFFRYAILICRSGGTVIFACSTELKSLFEKAIHTVEPLMADANMVTDQPSMPVSEFDEYISLMSLPKLFGTTPDSIPSQVPYLFAPETSSIHLETTSSTLRIGITWAGNPMNQENEKRSYPLTELLPLLNLENIDFYSLQVGPESQQLENLPPTVTVRDLSPQLKDFADTAAAIAQLDLVITVDTAVAHLAGAMAKPVWVLLAYLPDWRWLLDRDDSPWYPTMRLFRQTQPGDWAGVIQRVKIALQELAIQNSKFKIQNLTPSTTSTQIDVLLQQGNQCTQTQDWAGAIHYFQMAKHLQPDLLPAEKGLAWAFQHQGQLDLAIQHYQQAIALAPHAYELYINLGSLLAESYRFTEAVTYYQRAIQLRPDLAPAYSNLANVYQAQGYLTEAIAYFQKALAITPDLPEAHYGLGTTYLLQGNFQAGWAGYEWRFKVNSFQYNFSHLQNETHLRWDGNPLQGQRILLCSEQGFGDKIQFIRYAALVADRGGTVVISCQASLKRLLATAPGVTQVYDPDIAASEFDIYVPLLSLPYLFGTTLETIPASVPYLKAPTDHPLRLTPPLGTRLAVGIVWAGNPQNTKDRLRSCRLEQFLPLLQVPHIAFYSLQVGPASQQLTEQPAAITVWDLSPHLHDFADTAAAITQLDLVITVDTAVAHLAGALAKPVWVLLSHTPDWRWLLDTPSASCNYREHSPWYPTMRLFRQTELGDWAGVIQRVKTALQEWMMPPSTFNLQNSLVNPEQSTHPPVVIQPTTLTPALQPAHPTATREQATDTPATQHLVTKIPTQIAIDWSMQLTSGWGVYGFNLALQLLRRQSCQPIALRPPLVRLEDLNPLCQRLLLPYFQSYQHIEQITSQHPGQTIALGMPVLQALGNNFVGADRLQAFRGDRTVGVIFSENTRFTPDALAIAQQYDWIIAGSHWNEAVLRQHGLTRVSTVLQGIDPTYFHPAPRLNLFPDRFVIFSGGKLEYRKGQDIIVAAFKHFQQRHPDALLITAWQTHWPQYMSGMEHTGNVIGLPTLGSNRQLEIIPWLIQNGIPAEAVIDLGMVPNHQMPNILREADVAVFTNRAEGGTNLVAMECLATGLPTILSANTGHLDLLRDDLNLDHCYGLRSQGPVRPNAHFPAVDGWGESIVEEVLEQLEGVYQNREAAKQKGDRAAQFMRTLTWETQTQRLLHTLGCLYASD
ncbi:tetratricopeptide repeat protein [Trichothermofontia sp.]